MGGARTGPSLAWRLAAAVALTIGFYTLAILIAAALLAVAILPWVLGGSSNVWVSVDVLHPRRHDPGGDLPAAEQVRAARACASRKDDQPRLLGMIEEEATDHGRAGARRGVRDAGGQRLRHGGPRQADHDDRRAAAAHHVRARHARHHRPRVRPLRRRRHAARPVGLADLRRRRAHDRLPDRRRRRRRLDAACRPAAVHLVRQRVHAHHARRSSAGRSSPPTSWPPAARAATPTPRRSGASTRTARRSTPTGRTRSPPCSGRASGRRSSTASASTCAASRSTRRRPSSSSSR